MLKLLFKTTAYYVIWQKFKKQILLILISIILIGLIESIYNDLFEVFKVNNRDSLGVLLFFKWLFISLIIAFNINVLRKTKVTIKEIDKEDSKQSIFTNYSKQEEEIIKKKEDLLTTTDLLLKKHEDKK